MRRFGRRRDAREAAVVRQVAAWCLHYPDDELRERLGLLESAVTGVRAAEPLLPVLRYLRETPASQAEQHYVEVFDTRPRRALYLTWYVHGDTRLRGGALADLMGRYRARGFRPADGELPDYLPLLLEFTATGGADAAREGERLLSRFRPALELLLRELDKVGTPYAGAVRAVLATVPRTDTRVSVDEQPLEAVGRDTVPGGNR